MSVLRSITIDAKPAALDIDITQTAVLVVDMQNDFGAEGGLMHRAGIDIGPIQATVQPTAQVVAAARQAGMRIVYLKMEFRPDLSDAGTAGSPNRLRLEPFNVGTAVKAPDGRPSRILIRDTWNTAILDELAPEPGDIIVSKHRYSGFLSNRPGHDPQVARRQIPRRDGGAPPAYASSPRSAMLCSETTRASSWKIVWRSRSGLTCLGAIMRQRCWFCSSTSRGLPTRAGSCERSAHTPDAGMESSSQS